MKNSPQTGSKRLRGQFLGRVAGLALLLLLAGCAVKMPPPVTYLCLPVVVQTPDGQATPGAYCRPHVIEAPR